MECSLERDGVELTARRESWISAGQTCDTSEPTLRLLRRGLPAADQLTSPEEVSRIGCVPPAADVEVSDGMPRPVRRAVNRAARWGHRADHRGAVSDVACGRDQPNALVATTIVAVLITIPFTFPTIRARRMVALHRKWRRAGRIPRNITRS